MFADTEYVEVEPRERETEFLENRGEEKPRKDIGKYEVH